MSEPLAPALSRWERENHRQPVGETDALRNFEDELCCSLSPGERVRVRAFFEFFYGNWRFGIQILALDLIHAQRDI